MQAKRKIIAAFTCASLVIALGVASLLWFFAQLETASDLRRHNLAVLTEANELLSALKDAETGQRGFLLTGDEAFLQPYLDVRDTLPNKLQSLSAHTRIPAAQQHLAVLRPMVHARLAMLKQLIALRRNQDTEAAIAAVRSGEGMRLMDGIRAELGAFITIQQTALALHDAQFQAKLRQVLSLIVVGCFCVLLLAFLFVYLVFQQNRQRLKILVLQETQALLKIQDQSNLQLKQANATLLVSEEKLAVTLNSIGEAVIATDAEARVSLLNPIAEVLTGWTQAQALGRPIADIFNIINKKTRAVASMPVLETLAHGTVQALANHTVLIARDGVERDIAESCAPILDRDAQVIGAVLVFRDVSEDHAVQQKLSDSAALIQTVLNTVADGIITLHAKDGTIEKVNPAAEQMFGFSALDLHAQNFSKLFVDLPAEGLNVWLEACQENIATRAAGHGPEVLGKRQDGSTFPMEIAVSEMQLGSERYFTCILRDITLRKDVEDALLKAGALQNAIFNSANFSSIATDAKGVIQIFNVGAERMLGYAAAEVMNQLTPADISEPTEIIRRAQSLSDELGTPIAPGFEALVFKASRGIEDIYELSYIRKDGSRFPAVVSVTALRDAQNAIIGYLLIGTDNTARKQAEEALLKAGALQNAIFNSANFSSIATDAKGVIQIFNVGAERMLGYAAIDVMNKITPADISDPSEVIARAQALSIELGTPIAPGFEALVFKASRGIEDIYELSYIRKDGSRFPAVVSVTALRDAQNAIIGYLLIGTDNTARKQAEDALLKAGALQNAIFNSANFSSIATDANGVIQIFNVGAERMLGYAAIDVMNKITPADISDPSEVIARAQALSIELGTPIAPGFEALVFKASRGIEDIYELSYIRKDGSRFPAVVSVTALRDAQNAIIGYLLIGTDNTARKQIEAEQSKLDQRLRDQQFYTRSLIESSIDALMTTDPAGIITDVNKQMEALTGCTRDELIGAPFKNYFTDPERAEAGIKRVLAENKVINYELTARARVWPDHGEAPRSGDGRGNTAMETVVSYNASTFYDRDRKLQGVFAAARDITERKRLDLVLQENNVELISAKLVAEKANLAKSDFLSSMSHELRTPLNAILGFAQLLEVGTPTPTVGQRRSIEHILQAGWYLLELINEILDLALIESGKLSLSTEPVSLAEVLQECQAMIEPQAHKRGIRVTFPGQQSEPAEAAIFVKADRTRLKQVLINLLSNAVKYNCAEGSVQVALQMLDGDQGAGRMRICVTDTGAGLSPEKIAQLFQPFNRLGQEANAEEGTGIGLVVSKRLVELMQGNIGVDSTPGHGCAFWIELETAPPPDSAHVNLDSLASTTAIAGHGSGDGDSAAPRHTLLYVEDNPANMLLVEQILASRPNLEVIGARDAISGIELARSRLPTLILMDINLPGMSGIEALAILIADAKTAHIPVIALSANAIPRDIEKGLEAGFFRYLTKPIKVTEFLGTIDLAMTFAAEV